MLAWATGEVTRGSLAGPVREFLARQDEACDPFDVVVEEVSADRMRCRVPAVADDREARSPFDTEIRFLVRPATARVERV